MQIAFGLHDVPGTLELARNVIIIRAHKKSPFARRHGTEFVCSIYNYYDRSVVFVICCDLLWKK